MRMYDCEMMMLSINKIFMKALLSWQCIATETGIVFSQAIENDSIRTPQNIARIGLVRCWLDILVYEVPEQINFNRSNQNN